MPSDANTMATDSSGSGWGAFLQKLAGAAVDTGMAVASAKLAGQSAAAQPAATVQPVATAPAAAPATATAAPVAANGGGLASVPKWALFGGGGLAFVLILILALRGKK